MFFFTTYLKPVEHRNKNHLFSSVIKWNEKQFKCSEHFYTVKRAFVKSERICGISGCLEFH